MILYNNPAGTSNELDVQNEWEENTQTQDDKEAGLRGYVQFNKYTHTHTTTVPEESTDCGRQFSINVGWA